MSGSNGNHAGDQRAEAYHPGGDSDEVARAAKLVTDAFEKADELAKHEAGSDYGRICPPLLLGPQRYRDPAIWGPDYRLRGTAPGAENTPEQIAEMKKVPLTQDPQYVAGSRILEQLDAQLGLTSGSE